MDNNQTGQNNQTSDSPEFNKLQNSQNPTTKKGRFSISLSTILSVCLIISVAIAGFFIYQNTILRKTIEKNIFPTNSPQLEPTPTPDPTADWETFTDPAGAYTFRYPSNWTKSNDGGLFNDPSQKFILDVETFKSDLTLENWIKTYRCKTIVSSIQTSGGCTPSSPGPIPNSQQYIFVAHYGSIHTVVKNGDSIFNIFLDAREPDPNFDEIKKVYNQILTTFIFTTANKTAALSKVCSSYPNTASITDCGEGVYGIVSSLLGGGITYLKSDGKEIQCPVVGPDSVTEECKELSKLKCKEVSCLTSQTPQPTSF